MALAIHVLKDYTLIHLKSSNTWKQGLMTTLTLLDSTYTYAFDCTLALNEGIRVGLQELHAMQCYGESSARVCVTRNC